MGILAAKHPNIDMAAMSANVKFMQDPVLNRMIVQADSVIPRFEKLRQQFNAIPRSDINLYNKVSNIMRKEFGDPQIVEVLSNRNSATMEALRAITGSAQFSDFRSKLELSIIDPSYNHEQMKVAIDNMEGALLAMKNARKILPWPDWRGEPNPQKQEIPQPSEGAMSLDEYIKKHSGGK